MAGGAAFLPAGDAWMRIQQSGFAKAQLDWKRTLVKASIAGFIIGLSALAAIVVSYDLPQWRQSGNNGNPGLTKMIFGLIFPVALWGIYWTETELLTGNMMSLVAGLLYYKNHSMAIGLLKNMGLVFIGNFIGCFLTSWIFGYHSGLLDGAPYPATVAATIELKVMGAEPYQIFLRGIIANYLVCLGVFAAAVCSNFDSMGKMVAMHAPIFLFAAMGAEHSIANCFMVPLGMMYGANVTVGDFVYRSIFLAACGNMVGGSLFMGCVMWYLYTFAPKLKRPRPQGYLPHEISAVLHMPSHHPADMHLIQGQFVEFNKRYTKRDGSPLEVVVTASLLRDSTGRPLKVMSQIRSADPNTGLCDPQAVPGVIIAALDEQGHASRIEFVDETLAHMLGYDAMNVDELSKMTVEELTFKDDADITDTAFKRLLHVGGTSGGLLEAGRIVQTVSAAGGGGPSFALNTRETDSSLSSFSSASPLTTGVQVIPWSERQQGRATAQQPPPPRGSSSPRTETAAATGITAALSPTLQTQPPRQSFPGDMA